MTAKIELSILNLWIKILILILKQIINVQCPILMQDNTGKPMGDYPILEVSIRTTSNMYLYFQLFNMTKIKIKLILYH